jgi:hypothetical protein
MTLGAVLPRLLVDRTIVAGALSNGEGLGLARGERLRHVAVLPRTGEWPGEMSQRARRLPRPGDDDFHSGNLVAQSKALGYSEL